MKLTDLQPLEDWVALEKSIHARAGIDASVFDTNGIRITDYKKWVNRLCPVIKGNPKGQTFICASAHQNIAAMAQKTKEPVVEECDAGMVKIVVPVFVKGEFLGGVGGCGMLLGDDTEVETFLIGKTTGIDEEELIPLTEGIPRISQDDADALGRYIGGRVAEIVKKYEG
ncbi:MAG: PocR ligand-binding domain-containing protein [Pseudomonadota bacterium]